MVYTQEHPQDGCDPEAGASNCMVNKPGISSSSDGVSFSPAVGGQRYLDISGYPYNWTRADVNGGNVLLQVNDTLHLYFVDFKFRNYSVYRATAPAAATRARPKRNSRPALCGAHS